MKSLLKSIPRKFLSGRLLGALKGRKFIFCYHDVSEEREPHFAAGIYSTRPSEFREHLEFFRGYCHVCSLEEMLHNEGPEDKVRIALTFDDGFRSFATRALPLLRDYGMPATLFLNEEALTRNQLWISNLVMHGRDIPYLERLHEHFLQDACRLDEFCAQPLRYIYSFNFLEGDQEILRQPSGKLPPGTYLNLAEACDLRKQGVPIGNHTRHHLVLSRCTTSLLKSEIANNKRFLEESLDTAITQLAIPFGKKEHYTPETLRIARETGHTHAYTTNVTPADPNADPMRIPRLVLTNESVHEVIFYMNRTVFKNYDL